MFGFGFGSSGFDFPLPRSRDVSRGFSSSIGEVGAEQQQGVQTAMGGPLHRSESSVQDQISGYFGGGGGWDGSGSSLGTGRQAISAEMDSVMGQVSSFFGGGGGGVGDLWDSGGSVGGDASKWENMASQLGGAIGGGSLGSMFGWAGGGGSLGDLGWSRGNSALPMQTSELESRQQDMLGGIALDMEGGGGGGGAQAAAAEAAPTSEAISSAMGQATEEVRSVFDSISGMFDWGGGRSSARRRTPTGEVSEAISGQVSDWAAKAFGGGGSSRLGGKLKKASKKVSREIKRLFSW